MRSQPSAHVPASLFYMCTLSAIHTPLSARTPASLGYTNTIVGTATAEDMWEVSATVDTFDQLHAGGAFTARPRLVVVKCVDDSAIQFLPETIQARAASSPP